jgi:hypothetical protein
MKTESKTSGRPHWGAAVIAATLVLAACAASGPELAGVRGTVKMDGKPVPGAQLTFEPEGPGRAASGLANEQGEYVMEYTPESEGALVGPVLVRISTLTTDHPETIPPQYNTKSELKRTVEAGKNVFDFELESGGWTSKKRAGD